MIPLTVCCLFVQGEYPYTPDYVTRLHAMVTRWIDRPFRFCVLTDQPRLFHRTSDTVTVTKLAGFAPWTKLELFNPARGWRGRVLYLDLDSLIVAPLAPIIDFSAPFAITDDPGTAKQQRVRDSFGRAIVRRFNSSVMVWNGGMYPSLFTNWTPKVSERLSGDQCWIGEEFPGAATLPRHWFPRLSEVTGPPFGEAKVILAKVPKNAVAAEKFPWFREAWA